MRDITHRKRQEALTEGERRFPAINISLILVENETGLVGYARRPVRVNVRGVALLIVPAAFGDKVGRVLNLLVSSLCAHRPLPAPQKKENPVRMCGRAQFSVY